MVWPMYKWTYQTEIGEITIGANRNSITYLKTNATCAGEVKETDLIRDAYLQLNEYLSGDRNAFNLPLAIKGTPFQNQVWHATRGIPYGKTMTYQELAEMIDMPKAIRAVGTANGKNPIYIIIPCHRVIGSNGSLTGYGGGLAMKEKLLRLEGVKC
jgi:methylated-DNA-[protein]-cysteine S-methyltransferase